MKKSFVFLFLVFYMISFLPVLAETEPISLPEKVDALLADVEIVESTNFDTARDSNWELESSTKIKDGALILKGVSEWSGYAHPVKKISVNHGIIISYQYSAGSDFEIFLDHNYWGNEKYKRFGVYPHRLQANLFQGQQGLGWNYLPTNFYAKADTWYTILLAVGDGGDFLSVIWEKDKPENTARYRETIKTWDGLTWGLRLSADKGEIEFDDYYFLSFSKFK